MKTVIIGAGPGGLAVLEMFDQGKLAVLDLTLLAVVDRDPEAPGMVFARARGWPTLDSVHEAMAVPELELVIELTGNEDLLHDIIFLSPPGVRVMDHVLARVFWDLEEVHRNLEEELRLKTELEERVEEDRARLQEILDTIPDVVMVTNPKMRIERVNRRFEEVTGSSREEAKGRFCYQAYCHEATPEDCRQGRCPFREVMDSRGPVTFVQYSDGQRGKPGYYQISANPVFDAKGEIVHVVETSREITEQVMLKRETEDMARRYTQILNAVHTAITIKDLEGRYLLVNPRAERLLGSEESSLIGKTAREAFGEEAGRDIDAIDRAVLDGAGHEIAEEVRTFAGKEHALISERFPLYDYDGEPVAVCCVSREITRERELQRELLQTERLAAVGRLAAGVAHELNNPLTGILTFAEDLLLDVDADDPRREDYETIFNETMRCRRIVRDLLDFSRRRAPNKQQVTLGPTIRRTVTMVERQASFHNIEIRVEGLEDLPKVSVDPQQIQQAILNLLVNARDAMDGRGRVRIGGGLRAEQREVLISVADNGPGISPELREQIFEPFFSTKGEHGNGLGLPAVASVMEQHGGQLELDGEPGAGATFRLVFPMAPGGSET